MIGLFLRTLKLCFVHACLFLKNLSILAGGSVEMKPAAYGICFNVDLMAAFDFSVRKKLYVVSFFSHQNNLIFMFSTT